MGSTVRLSIPFFDLGLGYRAGKGADTGQSNLLWVFQWQLGALEGRNTELGTFGTAVRQQRRYLGSVTFSNTQGNTCSGNMREMQMKKARLPRRTTHT